MTEHHRVSDIALALGLDPTELAQAVARLSKIEGSEINSSPRQLLVDALCKFYPDSELEKQGLGRYKFQVDGNDVSTYIVSKRDWHGLVLPVEGDSQEFDVVGAEPERIHATEREIAPYVARILHGNTRNWDNPIYRLLSIQLEPGSIRTTFAVDRFLRYRFTLGLLGDELEHHLAKGGSLDRRALPLRDRWLSSTVALTAFDNRICAGGVNVLVAIARSEPESDYAFLLHARSSRVSEGQYLMSVTAMGYHEPMQDTRIEVSPVFTVFRELYEELFGGHETIRSRTLVNPQFFYRGNAPLEWLRMHPASFNLYLTGFGINLLQGNYEFTYLLIIRNGTFWKNFGSALVMNWESQHGAGLQIVSSQDALALSDRLRADTWAGSSLFAFSEGLRCLSMLNPESVKIPATFQIQ